MRYELLEELKAVHGSEVDFLVAANQRKSERRKSGTRPTSGGDLIGGVVRGGNTVVVHYVREDYRHSGIGFILIKVPYSAHRLPYPSIVGTGNSCPWIRYS